MKKSLIVAAGITFCFVCFCAGVLVGRMSGHALPKSELPYSGEPTLYKVDTYFDQQEFIDQKVNINSASAETLMLLPGIGPGTAEKIIEYRKTVGPFTSVEELQFVEGMGKDKLDAIYHYVTVGDEANDP